VIEAQQQQRELLAIYRDDPCRTLPNAFWKTATQLGSSSHLSLQRDQAGHLTSLMLWVEDRLMAFWCANPEENVPCQLEVSSLPFALVHNNAFPIFRQSSFSRREAYFRLICTQPPKGSMPPGFRFETVDNATQIPAVAQMITDCYQDKQVSESIVRSWLGHPVYDPTLWVWVVEILTGKKVGLGIAEKDIRVPETSLEWIQVLPKYRGLGIGTAVVIELCKRAWQDGEFIIVSGKVNSNSQPEKLYRRCGFTGTDVWWLLVA